jgi:hypothetical protein
MNMDIGTDIDMNKDMD